MSNGTSADVIDEDADMADRLERAALEQLTFGQERYQARRWYTRPW